VANSLVTNGIETGFQIDAGTYAFRYNDVWASPHSGYTNYRNLSDQTGINGNVSVDPKYKDSEKGNYRLKYGSPVIDAADGSVAPKTDYMGAPRYDDPRTTNTGTPTATGAFSDMGAFEFVETADSDVDLVADWVVGPLEIEAGAQVRVKWQISNVGTGTAKGPWTDKVSLIADVPAGGVGELLTGGALHQGLLGPGESAVVETVIDVPGGNEGIYHWQVHANYLGEVYEGKNWGNNTGPNTSPTQLTISKLPVGTLIQGQFQVFRPEWFKIDQAAGQPLVVTIEARLGEWFKGELYAGYDRVPTKQDYDQHIRNLWGVYLEAPDVPRTVYLRLEWQSGYRDRTIYVWAPEFALLSVGINQGGNVGRVTIPLNGTAFLSTLQAQLRCSGVTYDALNILSYSLATFDLTGAQPGPCDVTVRQGSAESTLAGAFTIVQGKGPKLEIDVRLPENVRVGRPFIGTVEVTNSGDTDMPVPLLILEGGTDHPVWPWPWGTQYEDAKPTFQFLPLGEEAVTGGILGPGSVFFMKFNAILWTAGTASFKVVVKYADSTEPIDWDVIKAEVRPTSPQAHWDEGWAALTGKIGSTYGDYITFLARAHDEAAACSPLSTRSLRDLINYMVTKEIGLLSGPTVSGKVYLGDTTHSLSFVKVTLMERSFTEAFSTDSQCDGAFSLRDIPPGTYQLSVENYILNPWGEITVSGGSPVSGLEVIVGRGALLAGRVANRKDGTAVSDAIVSMKSEAGAIYDGVSSSDGRYAIRGLPGGVFTASVSSDSFLSPEPKTVTLTAGQLTTLSFDLSSGASVTGRVLAPDSTPVEGASVTVFDTANPGLKKTTSLSDGTYKVSGLVAGTYEAVASAAGFGAGVVESVVVLTDTVTSGVNITLSAAGQITGVVKDAVTLLPIQGASVTLETPGVSDELLWTDSSGQFTLNGVPSGTHNVHVTADRYNGGVTEVSLGSGETKSVEVLLRPLGSISGYVRDSNGTPLAGVTVSLISSLGFELTVVTGTDGYFSFTGLPDGDYKISVKGLGGLHTEEETFTLGALNNVFTVTKALNIARLRGTVLRHGGEPAGQVNVALVRNGEPSAAASTDDQGRYAFLIFQEGPVDVIGTGYAIGFQRVQGIDVHVGDDIAVPDIVGGGVLLNVSVKATSLGQPAVAGALISVQPSGAVFAGQDAILAMTDETGAGAIGNLSAGDYVVEVSADGMAPAFQAVAIGAAGGEVQFNLVRGRTVQGTVTDGEGLPVPWALLNFIDKGDGRFYLALADETGGYLRNSLPSGLFDVWVSQGLFRPAVVQDVNTGSEETQTLNVTLSAGGTTLKGLVKTESGEAIIGALVSLVDNAKVVHKSTLSGVDGSYRLEGLPEGTNRILVQVEGIPEKIEGIDLPALGEVHTDLTVADPYGIAIEPQTNQIPIKAFANPAGNAIADYVELLKDSWSTFWNEPKRAPGDTDAWRYQYRGATQPFGTVPDWMYYECPDVAYAVEACRKTGTILDNAYSNWWQIWSDFRLEAYRELGNAAYQMASLYLSAALAAEKVAEATLAIGQIAIELPGLTDELRDVFVSLGNIVSNVGVGIRSGDFDALGGALDGLTALHNYGMNYLKVHPDLLKNQKLAGKILGALGTIYSFYKTGKDILVDIPQHFKSYVDGYEAAKVLYEKAIPRHEANLAKLKDAMARCKKRDDDDPPPPPNPDPGDQDDTTAVISVDPNVKITVGYGAEGFVSSGTPLLYMIYFENQASASAPAQQVVITDQLGTQFDWSTVELISIGFNKVEIPIPGGPQEFETTTSVATDPYPVRVRAGFDGKTGLLTWMIESVDPITSGVPEDPFAGFLPPNASSCGGCGEGYVSFMVSPVAGLISGAAIKNSASIVFDVNTAIETNEVANTIDDIAPTSSVVALPALTRSESFSVGWTGSDNAGGSGVAFFDVYVSVDGGAFDLWQEGTEQTSAVYAGAYGHRYGFYSAATDHVGNRQATPSGAQASTGIPAVDVMVLLLDEGFDSGIPGIWMVTGEWVPGPVASGCGSGSIGLPFASPWAVIDATGACGAKGGETLYSPVFDTGPATELALTFSNQYRQGTSGSGTVSVSDDGGGVWSVVAAMTADEGAAEKAIDVSSLAGASEAQAAFEYAGSGGSWAVDNVRVTGRPAVLRFVSPLGVVSDSQRVLVVNNGASALTGLQMVVTGTNSGDFGVQNHCPASFGAGESCTVDVTFAPAASGERKAVLEVQSSDPVVPVRDVALTGNSESLWVSPGEGTMGTAVVIRGPAFGVKKGKVTVGGAALKVGTWEAQRITGVMSKVPGVGSQTVVVTPKEPKGAIAVTLVDGFEVKGPEVIWLDKVHGAVGETVTVVGKSFGTKKGKVYLGAKSCKVVTWTMDPVTGNSEVVFTVPKGLAKGAQDLKATNTVGTATRPGGFTID
jgi:hypothetical protein